MNLKLSPSGLMSGLASVLVSALCFAEAPAGEWNVIEQERGITVSRREQPGCGLPAFRGKGPVRGGVLQILALMLDSNSVEQWADGVDESRLLKRIDENQELIYLYSDVPWPVRDRDMVVRRTVEVVKPGEEFHIHLRCEPQATPEVSGVVRVKKCKSGFHLRRLDQSNTEIDYDMSLDPAGLLPKWAGSYVAKNVPFKTLVALEERAAETRGKYEAVVQRWSAASF
ncbi:MAG: START domain-containing protein [Myxococcales bacterium]